MAPASTLWDRRRTACRGREQRESSTRTKVRCRYRPPNAGPALIVCRGYKSCTCTTWRQISDGRCYCTNLISALSHCCDRSCSTPSGPHWLSVTFAAPNWLSKCLVGLTPHISQPDLPMDGLPTARTLCPDWLQKRTRQGWPTQRWVRLQRCLSNRCAQLRTLVREPPRVSPFPLQPFPSSSPSLTHDHPSRRATFCSLRVLALVAISFIRSILETPWRDSNAVSQSLTALPLSAACELYPAPHSITRLLDYS